MNTISDFGIPSTETLSIRDRMLAKFRALPINTVPNTLLVGLVREPFDDFYIVILQNGQSEELDDEGVRNWLSARGADEDLIQKGITQAWNFYSAAILIMSPKTPPQSSDPLSPNISIV